MGGPCCDVLVWLRCGACSAVLHDQPLELRESAAASQAKLQKDKAVAHSERIVSARLQHACQPLTKLQTYGA